MKMNADEITSVLKKEIEGYGAALTVDEVGTVHVTCYGSIATEIFLCAACYVREPFTRICVQGADVGCRGSDGLHPVLESQSFQYSARVRRNRDACPDLAQLRCLLEQPDPESALLECDSRGEPADAGTNDPDGHSGGHRY